ncbi:queuosine biosynthesis protein QueD [Enterococcus sp. DIV0212c]|uniref:6-carboxytetrahydropterin synthase QueD n=1 Tax=Enterococcus sp. DIV0212c TaxID=2230867 RepID=UPI001A9B1E5A|nr:6-carboxytetrahydropterin synthase QueD [Enterococcus sp. DIV0212c]MBO1352925.1 6-carboxytetrahydropterin synthase QueD [Enterococcus sp. DIV0212c]
MIITKIFQFDMAHMLDGHDGKCRNLHGHTYKLKTGIKGDLVQNGPKKGMVMDYGEIKDIVNENILSKMDHAYIFDKNSKVESEISSILIKNNQKVYCFEERTTAENLSKHIYKILKGKIPNLIFVEVFETPSSSAYFGDYNE